VQFDIERRPVEGKPVRKILEQRIESPLRLSGENRGEISGLNEAPRVKAEFGEPVSRTSKGPPAPTVLPGVPADAKSAAACNTRGRELLDQGKYREAIEELSEALRQKPDLALALNARGFAYYRLRDYKHALADFDEAIRLNPNYLNAYQNRSKARKAFAKSVVSKPTDTIPEGLVKPKEPEVPARAPAPVVSALVEPASRTRQPAAPAASPAVPADAKSAADCNARGRELLNQGKYREAIEALSQAVRQKPDFALALNARGFAYYRLRDYKQALADFDEAIRLNPNYLNAYQNRSNARKASGDDEGSLSDERKLHESR
jgi:tetratricopeptide (TPR) repeat protein